MDQTDGFTPETGLTVSQADIRLSKNGGNFAQPNDASGATHDELGLYSTQLNATDTNTLGTLVLAVYESSAARPVYHEFTILPANVYDSLIGDSDTLEADVSQIEGTDLSGTGGQLATAFTTFFNVATPTTTVNQVGDVVSISGDSGAADNLEAALDGTGGVTLDVTLGNNAIASASIASNAYASVTLDTASIADAVWDEVVSGHTTAGTYGLYFNHAEFSSVSDLSPSTTDFDGNSSDLSSTDDFYNGAVLTFLSGSLQGVSRKISDYTGSSRNLQFNGSTNQPDAAWPTAPSDGDKFMILGRIGTG